MATPKCRCGSATTVSVVYKDGIETRRCDKDGALMQIRRVVTGDGKDHALDTAA